MDRQTTLLLALGSLITAALTVGVSGWILLARDRRYAKMARVPGTGEAPHHEASEES
jgi:hypothetical protein